MAPPRKPIITAATRNLKRARHDGTSALDHHAKRPKTLQTAAAAPPSQLLNERPTRPLNIYAFGANSGGELGLGPSVKSGNVSKPRLNPYLSGPVGVVQVSLGAMHGVALTLDNQILTWGVNDHGALGRDTTWDGGMVDADDNTSDAESDEEGELNPKESTPAAVDRSGIPADVVFAQVAATDNATFALTSTGLVYGWGTFRSEDGKLAFSPTVQVQYRPTLIPSITGIAKICCGSNHVMALTAHGAVYTWGRGTEAQLGRRFSSRVVDWRKEGLLPRKVPGLTNVADLGTGANHSFAIDRSGAVYAWGFNNAGQTGVLDNAGEYESAYGYAVTVPTPILVKSLLRFGRITQITGGNFHSIAVTEDAKCLAWGRLYSFATGHRIDTLPSHFIVRDSRGKPSFLRVPAVVEGVEAMFAAAASEHSLAVTVDNRVYTWGLNLTKQLAQRDEEVEVATPLVHGSIVGKPIVWAGAGAQYSMLAECATPIAQNPA